MEKGARAFVEVRLYMRYKLSYNAPSIFYTLPEKNGRGGFPLSFVQECFYASHPPQYFFYFPS